MQRSSTHNQAEPEGSRTDLTANMLKAPSRSAPSFDVPQSVCRMGSKVAPDGRSVASKVTGLSGSNFEDKSEGRNLLELLIGSSVASTRTDRRNMCPLPAFNKTPASNVTDTKFASPAEPEAAGPEAPKGPSQMLLLKRMRKKREQAFRRAVDVPFTWYKLESRFKVDRQWRHGIYQPEEVVPIEATEEERAARLPPKDLRFDCTKPTNKRAYYRERERRQQCGQYIESLLKCEQFVKSEDP